MPKKLITYVITISTGFPKTHPRKGHRTYFQKSIFFGNKKHTIRHNYELWRKRFLKIDAGIACLSVRAWSAEPYKSKQVELFRFIKADGIGLQKLELTILGYFVNSVESDITTAELAKNDGLSLDDFKAWFKDGFKNEEPMAVVHFTNFRYNKTNNLCGI
jgi:hypothetical protein